LACRWTGSTRPPRVTFLRAGFERWKASAEVLAVVLSYYPPESLPVRTRLLLEEMLDEGR
jgi:hypothetical protein